MAAVSASPPSHSGSAGVEKDIPACYADTQGVMTSTTNTIAHHRITRQLGTVYGLTVRARNWGVDLGALLRSSVGGEIKPVTNLLYTARNKAMDRMVGEAMGRGGNAVVGVRFDVVSQGFLTQVCAYGTAVIVVEETTQSTNVDREDV